MDSILYEQILLKYIISYTTYITMKYLLIERSVSQIKSIFFEFISLEYPFK